jgi:hypothetical protein
MISLTSTGNRKRYSTASREMASTVLSKRGQNDGIAIHIPEYTVLKEMAAETE